MFAAIALAIASLAGAMQSIAQRGLEIPNAIVKQHNAYVLCQDEQFDVREVRDRQSFAAEVEKSIAACKDQKAKLAGEADRILVSAPGYEDPAKRPAAIAEAFDGYDALRREMALGGSSK